MKEEFQVVCVSVYENESNQKRILSLGFLGRVDENSLIITMTFDDAYKFIESNNLCLYVELNGVKNFLVAYTIKNNEKIISVSVDGYRGNFLFNLPQCED